MKSTKYLERLKADKKLNDTELAKLLGVTQPAISQYKAGKRIMDEETCLAVALALDIDPLEIIAAAGLDRAEKTGQKSLWEVFMMRTAATASALLFALTVNLFLTENAANAATTRDNESLSLYYVKLQIKKRLQKLIKLTVNWAINAIAKLTLFNPAAFKSATS